MLNPRQRKATPEAHRANCNEKNLRRFCGADAHAPQMPMSELVERAVEVTRALHATSSADTPEVVSASASRAATALLRFHLFLLQGKPLMRQYAPLVSAATALARVVTSHVAALASAAASSGASASTAATTTTSEGHVARSLRACLEFTPRFDATRTIAEGSSTTIDADVAHRPGQEPTHSCVLL